MVRRRGLPLLALFGAIVLLLLGGLSVGSDRARDASVRDRTLATVVQAEKAALEAYFSRARDIVRLTAHDPAFARFYDDPRPRSVRVADPAATADLTAALSYLEELYPGAIGEACFIDVTGSENARIVNGQPASPGDLSTNERTNLFFASTVALQPGEVHQAEPYRSADTGEWVVSNSTPLVGRDGRVVAIIHFEVTVESFRRALAAAIPPSVAAVVVNAATGDVVLDARKPQLPQTPLGSPGETGFRSLAGREVAGLRDVRSDRVAFASVDRDPGNANRWYVAATARRPALTSFAGFGPFSVVCFGGALVLLVAALLLARRDRHAHELELSGAREAGRVAEERSRTDSLTGLVNRRGCTEALVTALRRAERDGHVPAVLLVDADRFKRINDNYGHQAGDTVLVEIARRLREAVRSYDIVARWGGEEFAVLVPGVDSEEALRAIGDQLRRAVSRAPVVAGPDLLLPVTVSVGGVRGAEALWSPEGLVDAADRALYAAKRRGRDQVRLFSEMTVDDFVAEEPEALRLAQALALSAAVREGMPEVHSQEVAKLSGAMAQALGLDEAMVLRCQLGGWLHDIGKVAIPDSILAKTSVLDPAEWASMRTHTVVGEQLIRRIAGLAEAADAVRSHHERWDGNGYPDGLVAAAIPLEARIVAAADAYSAITSNRPYHSAETREVAIAELRRSAGSHLDPAVVAALARVLGDLADSEDALRARSA